ncbi:VWA domain-containing protein, partial [Candidatus Woesearchaeota archaeon]|nr:VWA domain-containing protein [Candidatus Woesearchaeota archaeon]
MSSFNLTAQNKYYLLLLLIIPLMVFLHFFYHRHSKKRAVKFANFEALKKVTGSTLITKNLTTLLLKSLILASLILAMAGVEVWYLTNQANTDYVIVLDSGGSMNAVDVDPNRYELAKTFSKRLITYLVEARVGFVSFAGTILSSSKPTYDKGLLLGLVENSKISYSGTDLALGITTAIEKFDDDSNNTKTIILVSDGHDTVGFPLSSALTRAIEEHVSIISVGVGTIEGGAFITNPSLPSIISKLEVNNLRLLSNSTESLFFELEQETDIDGIFQNINFDTRETFKAINLSNYLLLSSFLLLVLEWVLSNTRFR